MYCRGFSLYRIDHLNKQNKIPSLPQVTTSWQDAWLHLTAEERRDGRTNVCIAQQGFQITGVLVVGQNSILKQEDMFMPPYDKMEIDT